MTNPTYVTSFRYNVICICVVNVRTVVDDYEFDKNDKIHRVSGRQQETPSLSDTTRSHYLKHQRIVYANRISKEETKL